MHTSDQDMDIAQANIQDALNNVSSWTRRKGFKISPEKTLAMYICWKRIHNHRDPEIRLNGHRLEIKNTHKILGLILDLENLIKCLAGMNWGADQGMLLR
jgi:hypothetical protein